METDYHIGHKQGVHTLSVQLPGDLVCAHCILQWRHTTGVYDRQECQI